MEGDNPALKKVEEKNNSMKSVKTKTTNQLRSSPGPKLKRKIKCQKKNRSAKNKKATSTELKRQGEILDAKMRLTSQKFKMSY